MLLFSAEHLVSVNFLADRDRFGVCNVVLLQFSPKLKFEPEPLRTWPRSGHRSGQWKKLEPWSSVWFNGLGFFCDPIQTGSNTTDPHTNKRQKKNGSHLLKVSMWFLSATSTSWSSKKCVTLPGGPFKEQSSKLSIWRQFGKWFESRFRGGIWVSEL